MKKLYKCEMIVFNTKTNYCVTFDEQGNTLEITIINKNSKIVMILLLFYRRVIFNMPLEIGGRADKMGNRYEIKCIIYEMLKVFREVNYSIVIEALGEDEVGTDILITDSAGKKEHQQCKARNASKEYWSIADLKARGILDNWKKQLERSEDRKVAIVSAIGCSYIVDLHNRAVNSTDNPKDFYEHQIKTASQEFHNSYIDFCKGMGLDVDEISDIAKSINFLKRISFKQMPEYTLRESISQEINYYYTTDIESVYNAFVALVVDNDIYGKEVTALALREYFTKQGIQMRMLDRDNRILPQIKSVNEEYRVGFKPLNEGLIDRIEFKECIETIKAEQSFVISGNAGYGKSGCAEAILNYCEQEDIPYIAIKLDRKIPHGNSVLWGQELGFQGSIVHTLNVVSIDKNAVIVLDQLDALRWTQANSSESLSVCMEMIRQVNYLNNERKKKIIMVFVCREYDLQNDNNIKSLFERNEKDTRRLEWKKIVVKNFDENIVKKVVGEKYQDFNLKTRRLLQVPSNLYIWQHLDEGVIDSDCMTTSHLVDKWFQQICQKSNSLGVDEKVVKATVHYIVDELDKIGRLYVPKRILNIEERGLDYLVYAELLIIDGGKVGFVHQSILDYFISNRMTKMFLVGEEIEQIIGEKNKQTPGKRYQVQMFLQNLLEYDSGVFLSAGIQMIESSNIRFYVKYVFYEILRQVTELDDKIIEYVKKECREESRWEYFVNNVVCGKHAYITILREFGILEDWFSDDRKKNTVFVLLKSLGLDLDIKDIEFIKKHSFVNEEDDKQFMGCFLHDFSKESDELFELRFLFYNKYPSWSQELYIHTKEMMKHCELRTVRLISFWLKNKIMSKGKNVYRYEEELFNETDSYLLQEGKYVLNELLQYIPLQDANELFFSDWSGGFLNRRSLERVAVVLIKKANVAIIARDAECFWEYYAPYLGKNYAIFNELILHALQFMPTTYSDKVIGYLTGDFDKKVFDYTSGAEEQLGLVKKALGIHTSYCTESCLNTFLRAVEKYVSAQSCERYRRRIEHNQKKACSPVFWSFWGDFQYHILQCVPNERLTPKYRDLLKVLDRKFQGKTDLYMNRYGHWGSVKSPITGKKIGKKQWLQIITNNKLADRNRSRWKEVHGGFIESSIDMYMGDFQSAVKENPVEMIKMLIENKENVLPAYINSLYMGVEFSDYIEQVEKNLLEKMFSKFPCEVNSQRALYFCGIIEKTKIYSWSDAVIEKLKEIAIYYENGEEEKIQDSKELNCEELISRSLNCVKGYAMRAIGHLLWGNKTLFEKFKDVVDKLILDDDAAVRMACFEALWPIYNIDREWAETRILRIYESDVRIGGFQYSKDMFFRLYLKYKERTLSIIKKCFDAGDEKLIEMGGYTVCEFYIRYNEFETVMSNVEQLNEKQIKSILSMAVIYLKYDEYREISKAIILKYKNSGIDAEFSLGSMFFNNLVDVERDFEFLKTIMKSKVNSRMVYAFVHFLEKNAYSVKDYAEIIIALCENLLSKPKEELSTPWGIGSDISKLIIALYDETANSENVLDCEVARKCLDLWDVMFEKQIGQVRYLSKKLMER